MLSANTSFTLFSANQRPKVPSAITIKPIPYVPPSISVNLLQPNGKLFDDLTTSLLEQYKLSGRVSKHHFQTPFSIYQDENGIFTIAPGKFGAGAFGRVKGMQHQRTKNFAAFKIIALKMPRYTNPDIKKIYAMQKEKKSFDVEKEYQNLKHLNQAISVPLERESTKKNEWQMMMIMKLAEGISLDQLLKSKFAKKIPALIWIQIAVDLIDALLELHTKYNMLHCDVKPANVVYQLAEKRATLVDFGFAGIKDNKGMVFSNKPLGTPLYMNPRIRRQWKKWQPEADKHPDRNVISLTYFNEKSDVFALGTALAELFALFYPPRSVKEFDLDKNYIAKPGHTLYDNNTRIGHPRLLASIVEYLQKMTSTDEDSIPSMLAIKDFFMSIKALALTACPKIKVAFMNADEYLKGDQVEKLKLREKLNDADEIRFYDVEDRGDMVYEKLKAELEVHFPIVGSTVAISKDTSLIEQSLSIILDNENGGKLSGYYEPYVVSNRITNTNDGVLTQHLSPQFFHP